MRVSFHGHGGSFFRVHMTFHLAYSNERNISNAIGTGYDAGYRYTRDSPGATSNKTPE